MTPEEGAQGSMEEETAKTEVSASGEQQAQGVEIETATSAPQTEGRRTQLKIVREGVEDLRTDVWKLTRSHDSRMTKLEDQVKTLRAELAAHARSREVSEQVKKHASQTKALHKEVAALRAELAAMRGASARDAARAKAREEAAFSKILTKVGTKAKLPARRKKK